jgi:hypothetical protein
VYDSLNLQYPLQAHPHRIWYQDLKEELEINLLLRPRRLIEELPS